MTTPPDPQAEWWTTSEVAAYIGVRVATVVTYRTREQMPAPDMIVGRTHMCRPARIVEWHALRPTLEWEAGLSLALRLAARS
jgi:hypothetical protein